MRVQAGERKAELRFPVYTCTEQKLRCTMNVSVSWQGYVPFLKSNVKHLLHSLARARHPRPASHEGGSSRDGHEFWVPEQASGRRFPVRIQTAVHKPNPYGSSPQEQTIYDLSGSEPQGDLRRDTSNRISFVIFWGRVKGRYGGGREETQRKFERGHSSSQSSILEKYSNVMRFFSFAPILREKRKLSSPSEPWAACSRCDCAIVHLWRNSPCSLLTWSYAWVELVAIVSICRPLNYNFSSSIAQVTRKSKHSCRNGNL